MDQILDIQQLEAAINWWLRRRPGRRADLSPAVRRLSSLYGRMIYHHERAVAWSLLDQWQRVAVGRALGALAATATGGAGQGGADQGQG